MNISDLNDQEIWGNSFEGRRDMDGWIESWRRCPLRRQATPKAESPPNIDPETPQDNESKNGPSSKEEKWQQAISSPGNVCLGFLMAECVMS